jgi:hypothetical protein
LIKIGAHEIQSAHSLRIPVACDTTVIEWRRFGGADGNILPIGGRCATDGMLLVAYSPANRQSEPGLVLQALLFKRCSAASRYHFFRHLAEKGGRECEFETVNAEAPANTT